MKNNKLAALPGTVEKIAEIARGVDSHADVTPKTVSGIKERQRRQIGTLRRREPDAYGIVAVVQECGADQVNVSGDRSINAGRPVDPDHHDLPMPQMKNVRGIHAKPDDTVIGIRNNEPKDLSGTGGCIDFPSIGQEKPAIYRGLDLKLAAIGSLKRHDR